MSGVDSGDWVFPELDVQAAVRAAARQQVLTKPRKSLGRLEELPEQRAVVLEERYQAVNKRRNPTAQFDEQVQSSAGSTGCSVGGEGQGQVGWALALLMLAGACRTRTRTR